MQHPTSFQSIPTILAGQENNTARDERQQKAWHSITASTGSQLSTDRPDVDAAEQLAYNDHASSLDIRSLSESNRSSCRGTSRHDRY